MNKIRQNSIQGIIIKRLKSYAFQDHVYVSHNRTQNVELDSRRIWRQNITFSLTFLKLVIQKCQILYCNQYNKPWKKCPSHRFQFQSWFHKGVLVLCHKALKQIIYHTVIFLICLCNKKINPWWLIHLNNQPQVSDYLFSQYSLSQKQTVLARWAQFLVIYMSCTTALKQDKLAEVCLLRDIWNKKS